MSALELKSGIHALVEKIDNERLLQAIYDFLISNNQSKPGALWNTLTENEKKEVLSSFEESEDKNLLISKEEFIKSL